MATVLGDHKAALQCLHEDLTAHKNAAAAAAAAAADRIEELNEQLAAVDAAHARAIEGLKTDHVSEIEALQAEWQTKLEVAVASRQREAEVAIETLHARHAVEVAALNDAQAKLEADKTTAQQRAEALVKEHAADLEKAAAEHTAAVETAAAATALLLAQLEQSACETARVLLGERQPILLLNMLPLWRESSRTTLQPLLQRKLPASRIWKWRSVHSNSSTAVPWRRHTQVLLLKGMHSLLHTKLLLPFARKSIPHS